MTGLLLSAPYAFLHTSRATAFGGMPMILSKVSIIFIKSINKNY
jgi:hypothetical protein